MAILNEEQKRTVLQAVFAKLAEKKSNTNLTKPDFRAALAAVNSAFGNVWNVVDAAIPEPAKSNLTAKQKVYLFLLLAKVKYEEL